MKAFRKCWTSWAGNPVEVYLDPAGELRSGDILTQFQSMNVRPFITAEAWQRGRIERHGAIIKNMLDRMDAEKPIDSVQEFEKCLHVCIQAKNSLARIRGFSPEQLVLGKATPIPASLASDEQLSAHALAEGQGEDSEIFRKVSKGEHPPGKHSSWPRMMHQSAVHF